MNRNIPIYDLTILSLQHGDAPDVFLLNQKVETSRSLIDIPYRSNYYGVGICLRGNALLKANLETYELGNNWIVAMSPQVIKQWTHMSDEFETLTIFFTKDFITASDQSILDRLPYFESVARHGFHVSETESANIQQSLNYLQQKYGTTHPYRNEIIRNLIVILLYEIAAIYDQQNIELNPAQSRSQVLTQSFKVLLNAHFKSERSVKYYAEQLSVTAKHLTETVKAVTGRTAGEWIDASVVLEARVLLQNPSITIAQVSDLLNFADQSTFGKFFKNITGLSPAAYRQGR